MDMRQATVQRLRPILTSNRNKYMFPCITSLLIKLQRRTVSQMKALNKLIILYFIKKNLFEFKKGATVHRLRPILISKYKKLHVFTYISAPW